MLMHTSKSPCSLGQTYPSQTLSLHPIARSLYTLLVTAILSTIYASFFASHAAYILYSCVPTVRRRRNTSLGFCNNCSLFTNVTTHCPIPNLENKGLFQVRPLPFDQSGMAMPARDRAHSRHSWLGAWASPPRQDFSPRWRQGVINTCKESRV